MKTTMCKIYFSVFKCLHGSVVSFHHTDRKRQWLPSFDQYTGLPPLDKTEMWTMRLRLGFWKASIIFCRHSASFQRRLSGATGRLTDWQAAVCFSPPGGRLSPSQIRSADIFSALPLSRRMFGWADSTSKASEDESWERQSRGKTCRALPQMAPLNASESIMLCWGSVKLNLLEENRCAVS